MHPGGAEKALIGMLGAIDYSKYQVDLFLNRHEGELLADIPGEVNLLPENPRFSSLAEPIKVTIKRGQFDIVLGRLLAKGLTRLKTGKNRTDAGISGDYSHRFTRIFMPKIQRNIEYDLAISFMAPHYFIAQKVNAKTKIAWIHTDYSQISINRISQKKMWSQFDHIIAVSKGVADTFDQVFPELADKVVVVENILPVEQIRKQALQKVDDFPLDGTIRLLSVGRFSYPKNFDNVPFICRQLLDKGLPIKWYIIGYGSEEKKIRDSIKEAHVDNEVIILGKKRNPYPYIRQCDLYVQPSRYEGKAITVREAQTLMKPVVITNYPTAVSQVRNGLDGIIVPLDTNNCADGIAAVLNNRPLMDELSHQCSLFDYSARSEIEKIYRMME